MQFTPMRIISLFILTGFGTSYPYTLLHSSSLYRYEVAVLVQQIISTPCNLSLQLHTYLSVFSCRVHGVSETLAVRIGSHPSFA